MPHPTLEQRLATLESQFQELRNERNGRSDVQPTGWRHAVEKYADDADLLSVFSDALKLREVNRQHREQRQSQLISTESPGDALNVPPSEAPNESARNLTDQS